MWTRVRCLQPSEDIVAVVLSIKERFFDLF